MNSVAATARAIVYGLTLSALVQGVFACLGYWMAGLPAPGTLAAVTGLLLWGALVVSWVDNVIRPWILVDAVNIPFVLALFGVLGGVVAFGLVGLFLGPAILAVA